MARIYLPVYLARPDLVREGLLFLEGQASRGTLRAHVAQTLPLDKTAEAHRLLEEQEIVGAVTLYPKA